MGEVQPPYEPGPPMQPHRGVMILVFGLLGLVPCCLSIVFPILAWVFGSQDLREMRAGRMDPSGQGLTQAGMILGIVTVVVQVVLSIVVLFAKISASHVGIQPR